MALKTNELYSSSSQGALPNLVPTGTISATFAPGAGSILPLQAVAFNSSLNKWVPWANGGADGAGTIRGFLVGSNYGVDPSAGITLDGSDDTLGTVMVRGDIDYKSIPVVGGTEAQLQAALLVGVREAGILVHNHPDQVR